MEKIKTIIDRERLSSDYIDSKQDFKKVLNRATPTTQPAWKTPWFYGPIGLAVTAITISIVSLNPTNAFSKSGHDTVDLNQRVTAETTIKKDKLKSVATEGVEAMETKLAEEVETQAIVTSKTIVNEDLDKELHSNKHHVGEEEVKPIVSEKLEVASSSITASKNYKFPHIEGIFTGDITIEKLFSPKGIEINKGTKITSFELTYFSGRSNTQKAIVGNTIPIEYKGIFETHNLGQVIFITKIKAVNSEGDVMNLPSLNYKLIK